MQRKKLISKTLTTAVMLALYIGGAQPSIVSAQEYTDQITGAGDAYAEHGIRTTVGTESTYTFAEGDVVKWTSSGPAVEVWGAGTHLKFTTPLNLQLDVQDSATSGIYVATSDYDTPGKLTAQDVTITGQSTGSNYDINRIYISGIEAYAADIQIKNLHIDVTADGKPESIADGIFMGRDLQDTDSEHLLTVTGDTNIKAVSKNSNGNRAWAAGIEAQDQAKMTFATLKIATEATSETLAQTNGIFAAGNSEINAGETHINVKGNAVTEGYSYGLNAIYSSQITLGDGSSIYAESNGDGEISAIGVRAGFYSEVNLGITDIRAENNSDGGTVDVLFVEDGAVLNMAGGSITGANNANNRKFNAINAYGEDPDPTWHTDTIVNINQGTANDVVIVGDVRAANTAIVNLNLNTDASSITGNLDQSGPYVDKDDSAGTINLTLANKATWHAMGEYGIGYSYLENLTLNDGSITMTNEEVQNIDINHLQGTGGELTLEADANLNTGFFRVNNADTDAAAVHTSYAGINADNVKDAAGLEGLVRNSLKIHDDSAAKFDVQVNEGLLIGQMQADTINHIDGNTIANVKIAQSTTVDAISHMQSAAALSWRQEDATLSKRLGDLRQGDSDQGFWVRLNRGEFKYGNAKNQNNFFQMGYDKAGGDWHYGAAISRNSGKTTYGDATAKNRSLALTLYGTWLGDKGHYADIVLKEGRLSNDYDISAPIGFTHGQYKTWGSSISAEYGREIAMGDKAYFTPQAQLSWLRIAGKDYTTANGIAISQDSQSSTIGRLGFELGSRLGDNGNVYAKASVLHDFGGSADTRLSYNGVSTTYSNDLGDTWYEAGIGFNLKTKDNSYLYADVSKAFGGDYKTPWQWNVGMRWTF
ncbi:autotransporter outer membrane beta-barrel domain-containing protein [uncultured Phascolarctobacterium sp.]|uniref:autotransporter outer membrane beta-barrel domain-containing protein n=1 Tax=uncultured Phascolarctobacterium sp. TaxID=512296 RepID=UPI0027DE7451|nr:autotransporter outer membrane beta-barrel domain-containing protein [uncultured Phascolarctobacterium sp.]